MKEMHKGRTTVAILAGIGIVATLFPWIDIWVKGMESGFVFDLGITIYYGFQTWYGLLSCIFFAVIAAFALLGNKKQMISKGFPKMSILVFSGLALLEALILLAVAGFSDKITALPGVYIVGFVSLATAAAPYLFKSDGTVGVPKLEEVIDDIEDSAEIVEDAVEDLGDKIDDKFDGDEEPADEGKPDEISKED
jgi:hypothetical protein